MNLKKLLSKGEKQLSVYFEQRSSSFDPTDWIEQSFRSQGVVVNGAKLTGKLDKIKMKGTDLQVFDLKTGKALRNWNDFRKGRKYRDQLIFYKLLIENSRDFGRYRVNEGVIEFVEPDDGEIVLLPYEIQDSDVEEMKKLIEVVYAKIMNLDFPDISAYPTDNKGKISDFGVALF